MKTLLSLCFLVSMLLCTSCKKELDLDSDQYYHVRELNKHLSIKCNRKPYWDGKNIRIKAKLALGEPMLLDGDKIALMDMQETYEFMDLYLSPGLDQQWLYEQVQQHLEGMVYVVAHGNAIEAVSQNPSTCRIRLKATLLNNEKIVFE
ncbi:MAG: hypothetical protein ACK4GL_01880 [Flavobacteriales bacterium]